MKLTTISDMARLSALQTRAINTRNALDKAATELTTGEKNSRYQATGGNLTRLFGIERAIDRNAVFSENIALTELRLDVMQQSLGQILSPTESVGLDLSISVDAGDVSASRMHADAARRAFIDTVGTLNSQVAGQSLFSGTMTDRPALADSSAILADLDALAAANPTAAGTIAAITDYFDAASGSVSNFFGDGYIGSTDDLMGVEIGEGRRIDYAFRADQAEIVDVLRSQALAAVVGGGAFAGPANEEMALLRESGQQMLAAKEGVLSLQSVVGMAQYTVELARAERISERDTLNLARAKIVAVDPLEAASAYQQLQVQLESVYTVTSRLANLRFSNFM